MSLRYKNKLKSLKKVKMSLWEKYKRYNLIRKDFIKIFVKEKVAKIIKKTKPLISP